MYLYGAKGHAKVVIELLELSGKKIDGLFDDNGEIVALSGYKVSSPPGKDEKITAEVVISIGDNEARKRISERFKFQYASVVHPKALVSLRSIIGEGTVVMGNATINCSTKIGKHVIVNTSASIDHDCIIEDFAHISPNATLCGNVHIGEGTHVGAGAVIIPGIKIGQWVTIGAGAVVITNIPDYAVVVGVPAKILKYNPHE